MIQRQQTLWLLLAAVASFLTFRFPFYTGNIIEENTKVFKELDSGSNFLLLVLTIVCLLLSSIAIFLFKDRSTQLKLAIAGILVSIGLVIKYIVEMMKFDNGNLALTSIFALIIVVSFLLATRGIWRDQKLVKSLDKLR